MRRELKSLKEDLRDELKPTIIENTSKMVEIPKLEKNSLKEKIMGKNPIKKQSFVKNETLNALLNETAQGDTNTGNSTTAPVGDPFSTSGIVPTETMPSTVQKVVNRDYRGLMEAINKKKGR